LAENQPAGGFQPTPVPVAARKLKVFNEIALGTAHACVQGVWRLIQMKTKLLALLFLVGYAAFAAPRVVVGVGVGVAPAYGYVAPAPVYVPPAPYVAPAPYPYVGAYWGPRAYYGPRWVGPRYYGRGYYGRGWHR
jgi:hypothetical protein